METLLLIVSVLMILIVLLQSNKATDGGQIITGGNDELFTRSIILRYIFSLIFSKLVPNGTFFMANLILLFVYF